MSMFQSPLNCQWRLESLKIKVVGFVMYEILLVGKVVVFISVACYCNVIGFGDFGGETAWGLCKE